MSLWHADTDAELHARGDTLVISSHHHVVRVVTSDSLSIHVASGNRIAAVVVDRTGISMRLSLEDGKQLLLSMSGDQSLMPPGELQPIFSKQTWTIQ
jgi:pSer/pThr/pTyr-binding forkhead associated (FHA) protein